MKFAATAPASKKKAVHTTNRAGGSSYEKSLKHKLASLMVTSMVSDQFYRSESKGIQEFLDLAEALISQGDAKFVAQATLVARKQFHLRSISHLGAAALGRAGIGQPWKRKFYSEVVERPDDVVEIIAASKGIHGKTIANAMKRGLADALARFSAYQLGKYKGKGTLTLIDAVNICHPKGNDQLSALMKGTLEAPETWEVLLSAAGSNKEAKARVWRNLLAEEKLGYMATLRNLRNIHEQADEETFTRALNLISNSAAVEKSKQLPFRFWSAMKIVEQSDMPSAAMVALDMALGYSCINVPEFDGKTLVAVDMSASMRSKIGGPRATMSCKEVAVLLAVLFARSNDADFAYFGEIAKTHRIHPTDSILGQVSKIQGFNQQRYQHQASESDHVGHATNYGSVFDMIGSKKYDRILFFTDEQSWRHNGTELQRYRNRTNTDPHLYICDLSGYGEAMVNPNHHKTHHLAGFSDKIFDLIAMSESGTDALIDTIEAVEI